jgi:hypothetical protein
MEWYYKLGDVRGGPVDHEMICQMVADGMLPLDARVWREGFGRFLPASILQGFKDIRAAAEGVHSPAAAAPAKGAPLTALMVDPWSPPPDADLDALAPPDQAEPVDQSEVIGVRAFFAGGQMIDGRGAGGPGDITQARPWVRLWARLIDGVVNGLIIMFVVPMVMPPIRTVGPAWIAMGCLLVLEAVYLSMFGTTPGKCLLGISVRGIEGGKPGFGEALVRAITVRIKGLGMGPLTGMLAYGRLMRNGSTSWDEYGGFVVRHERIGAGRAMLAAVACAVGIFMTAPTLMAASREISNVVQAQARSVVGPGSSTGDRAPSVAPAGPKPKPVRKAPPKKIVM